MRKLLPAFALVLLSGLTAGVVGADCPPGQPCIMSGGSNISSHSYEPVQVNGSDWSATLEVESKSPASNDTTERFANASYGTLDNSSEVAFDGVMQVPSSCYGPDLQASGEQGSYTLKVTENSTSDNDTMCTQVLTEIQYRVNFTAEQAFSLEAKQGNITETFQHPDFQETENNSDQDQEQNPGSNETGGERNETEEGSSNSENGFSGLFEWINDLF